eukprot:g2281.t1
MDLLCRNLAIPKLEHFDNLEVVKTPLFSWLRLKSVETVQEERSNMKSTGGGASKRKADNFKKRKKKTAKECPGTKETATEGSNFVREQIIRDRKPGEKWHGHVIRTRFPPEPNGYLHLGHAKSICLNFGLAKEFGGHCHLRMDDTNPTSEKVEYIESIKRDVKWLGGDWGDNFHHASNHFDKLYEMALVLVKKGLAYVDDQSKEEMDKTKGNITTKGTNSPFRDRTVAENLDLLNKMKEGKFSDGHCTLRAKIDMGHTQPCMRDPIMYRIRRHDPHPHTGTKWKIYPMYDFAHGLSDSIEGISHSICTLEFVPRRELYDWFVNNVGDAPCLPKNRPRPKQWEMSRLNLETVTLSKRRLIKLVEGKHVDGWDDPRMPTISGARRAGIPPAAIREFCRRVGVTKSKNLIQLAQWRSAIRDTLDPTAPRILAVINPLRVTITNMGEKEVVTLSSPFVPESHRASAPKKFHASREMSFGRHLFIEKEDFAESPPKGWKRLSVGLTVRLKYACFITCDSVVKDDKGNVVELKCRWDPETRGGSSTKTKPNGTIHWVSTLNSVPAEIRCFEPLFNVADPASLADETEFVRALNPTSRKTTHGYVEKVFRENPIFDKSTVYQFERVGFFALDSKDSSEKAVVFNRVVTLRDTYDNNKKKKDPSGRSSNNRRGNKNPDAITWQDFRAMSEEEKAKLSKKQRKKLEKKLNKAIKNGTAGASASPPPRASTSRITTKAKAGGASDGSDASIFDIRVGKVTKAWKHPTKDRLFCEHIDLGDRQVTVASGLWGKVTQAEFENSLVLLVCNLPPKKMDSDFTSNGMVLAAETQDGSVALLRPPSNARPGTKVCFEGCKGTPKSSNWMKRKRKQWAHMMASHFSTNDKGEACYKGAPWKVDGENVTTKPALGSASIK